MLRKIRFYYWVLGIGLLVTLLWSPALAGLQAQETPLASGGQAYELNLDNQGKLWVSDSVAGEIRRYDPATGNYTIYPVGGGPSDARGDGAGSVWWADFNSNRLSRLSTGNNQVTIWEIPGSTGLYSTAIDANGDIWVSDYYAAFLYQLDPDQDRLCAYSIPENGISEYLLVDGTQIWFGDYINRRIARLNSQALDWWNLPENSYPRDLDLDASGKVWWTDVGKGYLASLNPVSGNMTSYTPPSGGSPMMLEWDEGKVWFSTQSPSSVGVLDPASASGNTTPLASGSAAIVPDCSPLTPLTSSVTPSSGQASWTSQNYPTLASQTGWNVYQMPVNGIPWGITVAEQVWLVDQGAQKLVRFTESHRLYLPLVLN